MEKNFNAGVIALETYKKPLIVGNESIGGIIPLGAIAGLSAAKLAVIGVAAGLGLGAVAKGGNVIDSTHINALVARKDFGLE